VEGPYRRTVLRYAISAGSMATQDERIGMPRNKSAGLPSRKQILDFIASADQPAGKREVSRAFGLSGQDKIDLKRLLKDMADEGLIDSSPGRSFHQAGGVPKVTVLRVSQVDDSGHVFAVPEQW